MRHLWKMSGLAFLLQFAICLAVIDQMGQDALFSCVTLIFVLTIVVMFDSVRSYGMGTAAAVVITLIAAALAFGVFLVGGSVLAIVDIGVNALAVDSAFSRVFAPAVVDRAFVIATTIGGVAGVITFAAFGASFPGAFEEEPKGPFWGRFVCALPFGIGAMLGLPLVLSGVGRSTVAQPA